MELIIANEIGYCYGVEHAIARVIDESKNNDHSVYTYGQLIHNPIAVEELEKKYNIFSSDINDVPAGSVLAIRAHGISPVELEKLHTQGYKIIDTTCPFVKKTQQIATELVEDGYFVIIIGKKKHPEVKGIAGHVLGNSLIVENINDLVGLPTDKKIGVVFQSTITVEENEEILNVLKSRVEKLKIIETICGVTKKRQKAVETLSRLSDLIVVIGGKNSSNTKKLAEKCEKKGTNTIQIEEYSDLSCINLNIYNRIGIITGTSTPLSLIESIVEKINTEYNCKITRLDK